MRKSVFPRRRLTLEEYLAFEETSSLRHEFVAGEVYVMTGGPVRHNIITLSDDDVSVPVLDTHIAIADIYEDAKLPPLTVNEEDDEYEYADDE